MRRATMGVLIGGLGLATGAVAWRNARPRVEVVSPGATRALGVGVLGSREAFPPEMGNPTFLTMAGGDPLSLYLRLPDAARGLPTEVQPLGLPSKGVRARLVLPNGLSTPLGLQRTDERAGTAMVQIVREYPPSLPYLDVVVSVPGARDSRFRVRGLPPTRLAFDPTRLRTSQTVGAGRIVGRAWWDHASKPEGCPAVFAAYALEGVALDADEAYELQIAEETPFMGPDGKAPGLTGLGTLLDATHRSGGVWTATPYAPYVRAVRLQGKAIRRRVFDEWVDFGTVALRPRTLEGFKGERGWGDVQPKLTESRSATTPSGLRLTLLAKDTSDSTFYDYGDQTISLALSVDESTRARGLPTSFGGDGTVTVGVQPEGQRSWIFSTIGPRYLTFGAFQKKSGRRARLRLRVRRSVVLEEPAFSLVLPVAPKAERLYPASGSPMGGGSFEVDPRTLRPVR